MIGAHALTIKAGISYRQLDFWTRAGLLEAEQAVTGVSQGRWASQGQRRVGSGFPRTYNAENAALACFMGALTRAGIPAQLSREIAGRLLHGTDVRLGDFRLTYAGSEAS